MIFMDSNAVVPIQKTYWGESLYDLSFKLRFEPCEKITFKARYPELDISELILKTPNSNDVVEPSALSMEQIHKAIDMVNEWVDKESGIRHYYMGDFGILPMGDTHIARWR